MLHWFKILVRGGMCCLFFVLAQWPSFGQAPEEEVPRRFIGGIVAGINLSQIDGDDLSGFNQVGLNLGGRVAAVLAPRWQLSMEMLFSQEGSHRNLGDPASAGIDRIRLQMVEVPFMLHFLEWKFHVKAGFSYARVITYTVEDAFGEDVSDLQDYRPNLFFIRFGATYYFNPQIGLNLGWNKSLVNMEADNDAGTLLGRNIYIRGVYLF